MQSERLDPQTEARVRRHKITTDPRLFAHSFVVRLPQGSAPVHVDPHSLSGWRMQGPELCATLDLRKVPDTHWTVTSYGQRPSGHFLADVTVPEDPNDHEGFIAALAVARLAA